MHLESVGEHPKLSVLTWEVVHEKLHMSLR